MAKKIKLTDARIGKLKAGDVEYMVWDTLVHHNFLSRQ